MSILWLRPSVLRSFSSSVEFWFGLDMSSPPENTSLLGLWGNSGEKNHEMNIIVLNRWIYTCTSQYTGTTCILKQFRSIFNLLSWVNVKYLLIHVKWYKKLSLYSNIIMNNIALVHVFHQFNIIFNLLTHNYTWMNCQTHNL